MGVESRSTQEVFRIGAGRPLQGYYKAPWREAPRPPARQPWQDLTLEEATISVLNGNGLLLVGAPGTGKTHLLRQLILHLRQAGKHVDVIAKTHAAVQNVGCQAVTADHWVRKHVRNGGVGCSALVVEEITQINVQLWADLALCRFKGVQMICCGDFGQFAPICEHWAGCAVPEGALEHSQMLHEMCGGNRLTLTENKRSDAKLFNFYTNLGDLGVALARAREIFPRTDRPAAYTLTMSHARRVFVNRLRNRQDYLEKFSYGTSPEDVVFLKAPAQTSRAGNLPQDMFVWKGLQLIGAGGHAKKGLFYEVAEVNDKTVNFACGLQLTHEQAAKSLRLAYALTYASCQGLTLRGTVRLETDSPNFTMKHLYVGISRATAGDLAEVV